MQVFNLNLQHALAIDEMNILKKRIFIESQSRKFIDVHHIGSFNTGISLLRSLIFGIALALVYQKHHLSVMSSQIKCRFNVPPWNSGHNMAVMPNVRRYGYCTSPWDQDSVAESHNSDNKISWILVLDVTVFMPCCNNLRKGCLWSILKRALEKMITYFLYLILICHPFSWPLRRSLKGHPWKQLLYETLAILSDTRTYEWTQLNEVTMYFALEPIGRGSLYLTNAYNSTFRAQLCLGTLKRIFAISQRWGDVDDNISFID